MAERPWLPYLVLFVGVSAVSTSAILIREADAPFLAIACYRMAFAAAPVGALALLQHRRAPEPLFTNTLVPMILSGCLLAAHFAFWVRAVQETSIVTSVVLVTMQPLFVAIASPLLLRERVEPHIWLAIAVASAGALIMAAEDIGEGLGTLAGDLYATLGGMLAAAYLMVGRSVRPTTSWLRYIGVVYPVGALGLFAVLLVSGDDLGGFSTKAWLMIGGLAIGPQLIGHSSINFALAYLSAVIVAMAILLEPVGTTALAAVLLDERPTVAEMVGSVIVLAGVYMAIRPRREERLEMEIASAD